MIKERAHGKFILLGEHFVVHSQVPAIAMPLSDLWCEVTIEPSNKLEFYAEYDHVPKTNEDENQIHELMQKAFLAATSVFEIHSHSFQYKVSSRANFPISRGFGSSAAFAVALSKAVSKLNPQFSSKPELQQKSLLSTAAFTIEKIFHGNPSGLDTSVILENAPILFERKAPGEFYIKRIQNNCVDILLLDSGPRESSAILIDRISKTRIHNPAKWNSHVHTIKNNAYICAEYLPISTDDAASKVVQAIQSTHGVLTELGLVSSKMSSIIEKAISFGALAGKASGAGTGGATLIIAKLGTGNVLKQKLEDSGIHVVSLSNGNNT